MGEVDRWLDDHDQLPLKNVRTARDAIGGSKNMEVPLYAGAFNYLDVIELASFLRQVPWAEPERVQLFVNDQHDEEWRLWTV